MSSEKLYTVREAAAALGVSPALVYGLCSERKIRHERHGLKRGRIRIPQDALDEYRRSRTVEVSVPPPLPLARAPLRLNHLKLS